MDPNALIQVLLGVVIAGVGWWVKNLWSMVAQQQQMIVELQVELAKNYAPRAELQALFDRVFAKLDEIQRDMQK